MKMAGICRLCDHTLSIDRERQRAAIFEARRARLRISHMSIKWQVGFYGPLCKSSKPGRTCQ